MQYDPGLYLVYNNYGASPINSTPASAAANYTPVAGYATSKLGHRTIQLEAKLFF